MIQDFKKYDSLGAYHWKGYSGAPWRKKNLRLAARYALPLAELRARVAPRSVGIDAGCGDGVAVAEFQKSGFRSIGIEGTQDGVAKAATMLRAHRFQPALVRGDITNLPVSSASLDFVTALDVIEHLPDPAAFVKEAARLLTPKGVFIVTTPLRGAKGSDPYHIIEFNAEELRQLLAAEFHVVDIVSFTPPWLRRIYSPKTTNRTLKRVLHYLVQGPGALLGNPFVLATKLRVSGEDLMGVACRPRR